MPNVEDVYGKSIECIQAYNLLDYQSKTSTTLNGVVFEHSIVN